MTRRQGPRRIWLAASVAALAVSLAFHPAAAAERGQYKWPPWFPNKVKPLFETKQREPASRNAGRSAARKPAARPNGVSTSEPASRTDMPVDAKAAEDKASPRSAGDGTTGGKAGKPAAAVASATIPPEPAASPETSLDAGLDSGPAATAAAPDAGPMQARLPRPRPGGAAGNASAPLPQQADDPPDLAAAGFAPADPASQPAAVTARLAPAFETAEPEPLQPAGFTPDGSAAAAWTDPRGSVGATLAVPPDSPFAALPMTSSEGRLTTADREAANDADLEPADATGGSPDPGANAVAAIDELARLPRARPGGAIGKGPELAMAETGPPAELPSADTVPSLAPTAPDEGEFACRARLDAMGVSYKPLPALDPGGPCAVAQPLAVTAVGSGVRLASAATLNCATALALATWVRDSVVPGARKTLQATPTAIAPGSTYACRPRNNQAGAKLSEHGHANAFDVMSIAFAEREPLEVRAWPADSADGRFQNAIRSASCSYFTTVLGPGDAAHSNHLHLDLAVRRGGYRLCSLDGGQRVAGRTAVGRTVDAAVAPPGAKTKRE